MSGKAPIIIYILAVIGAIQVMKFLAEHMA
jgi:hypothetical protein